MSKSYQTSQELECEPTTSYTEEELETGYGNAYAADELAAQDEGFTEYVPYEEGVTESPDWSQPTAEDYPTYGTGEDMGEITLDEVDIVGSEKEAAMLVPATVVAGVTDFEGKPLEGYSLSWSLVDSKGNASSGTSTCGDGLCLASEDLFMPGPAQISISATGSAPDNVSSIRGVGKITIPEKGGAVHVTAAQNHAMYTGTSSGSIESGTSAEEGRSLEVSTEVGAEVPGVSVTTGVTGGRSSTNGASRGRSQSQGMEQEHRTPLPSFAISGG